MNMPNKAIFWSAVFMIFSFAHFSLAQSGFDDPEIIAVLKRKADESGIRVATLIEAAQEKFENIDMVRFIITVEGDLFVLDRDHQLFAVVAIFPIGSMEPEAITCVCNTDALTKRTSGILYMTDDIFGEDALKDNFEFCRSDAPAHALQVFLEEFEDTRPEFEGERKRLNKMYRGKKRAKLKRSDASFNPALFFGATGSGNL